MVFANDHDRLDFQLGDVAQGWLRIAEGAVRSGSIGIGVEAEPERGDEDAVTIEGEIASARSDRSIEGRGSGLLPEFPVGHERLQDRPRRRFSNVGFDNIVADVWNRPGKLQISVTAPAVEGFDGVAGRVRRPPSTCTI